MKLVLLTLGLSVISSESMAIQRYTSTSMNCAEVQRTIQRDGAAIMRYQSTRVKNLPLYGRYVRSKQFCQAGETAVPAYIPARDTKSCPVYDCERVDYDDPMFIRPGR